MSNTADFLLRGIVLGISIAAPVGPISMLIIQRTLREGRVSGLVTGLGGALADAVYGCVAAFGLTVISGLLMEHSGYIRFFGGIFLLILALKSFRSQPATTEAKVRSTGLASHLVTTFFLTLTNPATIISFLALFAGAGLVSQSVNYVSSSALVFGIFSGSVIWSLFLTWLLSRFRTRITHTGLVWINRLSGLILLGFAVWALYTCL